MKTLPLVLLLLSLAPRAAADTKLYWFIPDGMRADPRDFDVFRFAREGKYPNIKRMMERGTYGYSIPTYPSHTPTNFATLLTGAYPERHGVADGPMRVEGGPLARPSMTGFSSTAKTAPPVWKTFERNGLRTALVSVPGSTPPEIDDGLVVRGRWANWGADFHAMMFETTGGAKRRAGGERLFFMGPELTRFVEASPAAGWKKAPKSFSPPLELALAGHGATVHAYVYDPSDDGAVNYSAVRLSLDKSAPLADLKAENDWGPWRPITLFWGGRPIETQVKPCLVKIGPSGFVRLRLLYDLLNPTLVHPGDAAEQLRRAVGPMVDFPDNWPAQLNVYPEDKAVFLSEALMALDWHRRLARRLLRGRDYDVIIQDTYVPNQTLESRWWLGLVDRDSEDYAAATDAERAAAWEDLHKVYRGLDAILGEALDNAPKDALIVLSSDHGVIPLNRHVLLNNLFAREGLLKFAVSPETGEPVIDWAATRAVHLKMHGVYLHPDGLAGPWKRGAGPAYEALKKRVSALLTGLRDGGKAPLRRIVAWENAAELRMPKDRAADLILVVEPGYGLSEEMGPDLAVFKKPLEGGYKPGLHTPFIVVGPGVRKGHALSAPVRNADQAPTLLRLLGLAAPEHVQGRVIEELLQPRP
jgi:predicted AlkP superfamily phosphohydrolase/phosphomutase